MKIPLSWLKDYVDIDGDPEALALRMTLAGLEVDSVETIGELWDRDKLFVGQVLEVSQHPDADRLVLAKVAYGAETPLTVVTGAPNLYPYVGQDLTGGRGPKVAFAVAGARLIDGHSAERRIVRLKPGKLRGIVSEGMVCSEKELDLSDEHEGILILPADAPVGMPLFDYMGDTVISLDIKGAFGHLQSVTGIAREVAALTGVAFRRDVLTVMDRISVTLRPDPDFVRLVISDPDLCMRYSAALIENVKVGPSPLWMQQRLQRAGMRPISNVVDVTNYVMLELGQPLHAFDYDLLRQRAGGIPSIIVRRARPGEVMTTLDGVDRALDPDMLMITDTAGPVAVGGVMGGANTEVGDGTHSVLLEAANFHFLSIRRTSQLLRLNSEAASRFGKGVDPELTGAALARAGQLLAELAGGTVRPIFGDAYPGRPAARSISLDPDYVRRLLGIEITSEEMEAILTSLEFDVRREADVLQVVVPSHRLDVKIPADLVEEVGRVYGYDRLPITLMRDELPKQRRNVALEGEESVRDTLTGAGMDEVITYSMVDLADDARLQADRSAVDPAAYVRVLNPLTAEKSHLRLSLLPGLIKTAVANYRFMERVAIFEAGRVFLPQTNDVLPREPKMVAALMLGPREMRSWQPRDGSPMGFFDLKGVAESLLSRLGISEASWAPGAHMAMHPGRTAVLRLGEIECGYLGELHPVVRANFDLPELPVAVMELDLGVLLGSWGGAHEMRPISAQPAVYEDLAIIVDEGIAADQVLKLIRQTGGKLLVDVQLFDVYRGRPVPQGQKSLAYALTFQAEDRTLSDEDVQKLRAKIVGRLGRDLAATLRA